MSSNSFKKAQPGTDRKNKSKAKLSRTFFGSKVDWERDDVMVIVQGLVWTGLIKHGLLKQGLAKIATL